MTKLFETANFKGMPDINKMVYGQPWAIHGESYKHIQGVAASIVKDGASETFAKAIGREVSGDFMPEVRDGVAIIKISGVLMQNPGMIEMLFFGAANMKLIESNIVKAANNPDVEGILLDIDSPGGTVAGTQRLGRVIYENRAEKPIIAFTPSMMASAAYWIGSASNGIVAEESAEVGSIGVIITHVDQSKYNNDIGLKVTHIVAGKDKALGSPHEPLDARGKEYLQGLVNDSYTLFKDAVKLQRGNKIKNVDNVATGRVFTAKDALSKGLIDKIGVIEDAILLIKEGVNMDLATLKASHEVLVEELKAENKQEFESAIAKSHITIEASIALVDAAKAEALVEKEAFAKQSVADEGTRVKKINEAAIEGQEAIAAKMIDEGKTVEEAIGAFHADISAKIKAGTFSTKELTAEEKAKAAILATQNASAPGAIEQPGVQTSGESKTLAEQSAALKHDPDAHAKWRAENAEAISAENAKSNK